MSNSVSNSRTTATEAGGQILRGRTVVLGEYVIDEAERRNGRCRFKCRHLAIVGPSQVLCDFPEQRGFKTTDATGMQKRASLDKRWCG